MCNYDVLKCLMEFAKQNKAGEFKKYINAVNVKVKGTQTINVFTFHILFTLYSRGSLHCTTFQSNL